MQSQTITMTLQMRKLKQDVPTRWNSTFLMIQSVIKLQKYVNYVLAKPANIEHKEMSIKFTELILMEELVCLLEPIHEFTLLLEGKILNLFLF